MTPERSTLESFEAIFKKELEKRLKKRAAYESAELLHIGMFKRRRFKNYQSFASSLLNKGRRNS